MFAEAILPDAIKRDVQTENRAIRIIVFIYVELLGFAHGIFVEIPSGIPARGGY
ncbi:hypothetical protein [Haematospirillum jordaniae]|uniref:hypothetical protein n=1 Tax=Haematospirillum jordaniae TaxID=1549855 RepID=UPI00143318F3|nr:hypothetical protein [Haematospirillum jordaniae]NKD83866.1 hypothetical protein [Haematospirillum jordaniae]NKD84577.1 hypothetical protein [Haematospirillum jordaniae]